jgi:hypothetical protein
MKSRCTHYMIQTIIWKYKIKFTNKCPILVFLLIHHFRSNILVKIYQLTPGPGVFAWLTEYRNIFFPRKGVRCLRKCIIKALIRNLWRINQSAITGVQISFYLSCNRALSVCPSSRRQEERSHFCSNRCECPSAYLFATIGMSCSIIHNKSFISHHEQY